MAPGLDRDAGGRHRMALPAVQFALDALTSSTRRRSETGYESARTKRILIVALSMLTASPARAAVILDLGSALTTTDPLQLGRLSRNGVPQDWTGSEAFPGVINPTTSYHYHTYTVNVGLTPFIQVLFDSISTDTFVSAYDTSYSPNSAGAPNFGFDVNWLGDPGLSGVFFPGDPLFFQVIEPTNHLLVLVVSETLGSNAGVGDPFHLTVEGFVDTQFTDVPEPASLLLAGTGVGLTALRRRRRA